MNDLLRLLPSMTEVLARRGIRGLLRHWQPECVREVAREVLEELRQSMRRGQTIPELEAATGNRSVLLLRLVEARVAERLRELETPQLRPVVNATGVLLHTNLGRSRLSAQAAAEGARVAMEPVALEVDLQTGRRGRRGARIETLLRLLTGAPGAAVTNNGAAALWLSVRALCGRSTRVLVSRGEQVAIGGSFRMPELLRTTGARMIDVGTTNRTNRADYARELRPGDVVLKVHPSNYRVTGFHEEASLTELGDLTRDRGATLIYDAGSGSLIDYTRFGLHGEDTVRSCLEAGCDVVTFSGDKLLGGPQAGLAVGSREAIDRVARHPLMRALRCDKMVLATLEQTLLSYARRPAGAVPDLPLFHALETGPGRLRDRARALVRDLEASAPPGWRLRARKSEAAVGGGSFSSDPIPSWELCLLAPDSGAALRLHQGLRRGDPAVYTRIADREVACDLRSVDACELDLIVAGVRHHWAARAEVESHQESA